MAYTFRKNGKLTDIDEISSFKEANYRLNELNNNARKGIIYTMYYDGKEVKMLKLKNSLTKACKEIMENIRTNPYYFIGLNGGSSNPFYK